MARPRKTDRNTIMVKLHDEEGKSFAELAGMFNIHRGSAYEAYKRMKGEWKHGKKQPK